MKLFDHRRFVPGVALVVCLVLLGHWAMRSDDAANEPLRTDSHTEQLASIDDPPATVPSPASTDSVADTASAASDSASSFGILRGRVIDAVKREPVREFELKFQGTQPTKVGDEAPGTRTFRSGDGRFEWQNVPAGEWTVLAGARGYQRFELRALRIVSGEATPEIVLPLRPGHTLLGRVYDEATGAGIASANIGFRESHVGAFEGNWRSRPYFTSQKNGSFVLEGIPPGRVMLWAGARDHAGREIEVVVDENTSPLEIGLAVGGTIAGKLTAADGLTPVAGSAGLFDLDRHFGGTSRTGEAGEFSFEHLRAGRYQLTGQAAAAAASREIVLASNERIAGIMLALGVGRSIRGTVTGLRPEDLKLVSVSMRRDDGAENHGATVGVDDRGAYELLGVQPGSLQVVADVSMRRQLSRTIRMPEDADMTVNLDFPSGARLTGRVSRNGEPLSGMWVTPRPVAKQDVYIYGARTSRDGKYAIEDLAAGDYNVGVEGHSSRPVTISGDTVLDIDVPAAHLSGRVLEEEGKVPIVGADVDIWSAQPDSTRIRLSGGSDDFGQFVLAGLEPGDFILTAYKPGYEMFRERISYVSPVAGMTIRLRRSMGAEIRVCEAGSGKPLREIFAIEMIGDRNGSRLRLHLDEDGRGSIPVALSGSTLSFAAIGYDPAAIGAWSGQKLDLRLERKKAQ